MLGTDVSRAFAAAGYTVTGTGLAEHIDCGVIGLDITRPDDVHALFQAVRPHIVLHCAAFTDVDACERDPELAYKINRDGTSNVARAAEAIGASLMVTSSDYVFDGQSRVPYTENHEPRPVNVYGASKLAGEKSAMAACQRCFVVRTSWLYGVLGKNFPYSIVNRAATAPEISVVDDQIGVPTFTRDLAEAILWIAENCLPGTYHVSNTGPTTWYDFARAVLDRCGWDSTRLNPVSSVAYREAFASPTIRPSYSVLDNAALRTVGYGPLRPWQDALTDFLRSAQERGALQMKNAGQP